MNNIGWYQFCQRYCDSSPDGHSMKLAGSPSCFFEALNLWAASEILEADLKHIYLGRGGVGSSAEISGTSNEIPCKFDS